MKKFTVLFAAALALALFAGLFASCDAGEDNSQVVLGYLRAAEQERRNSILNGFKLEISQGGSSLIGSVVETGIRKFGSDGENHVVMTFTAYPEENYSFSIAGVSANYDGVNTVNPVLDASNNCVFTVTVPAGIKNVVVTVSAGAFVQNQN